MFGNFSFSKALDTAFSVGKDLLLGEKVMTSDMARRGESPTRGGGFLDLVSYGAKKYVEMQDDKEGKGPFETTQREDPVITRYRGRQAPGGLTAAQRWQPASQIYQDAIIRRMKQMNFERNLEKMTASTTVRPTATRKSPQRLDPATIKRTTSAPRLKP